MKEENYIYLYRDIYKCAFWYDKPFTRAQAWIDLLMQAYWIDGKKLKGSTWFEVKRGEVLTSELDLMNRWGWGKEKTRSFLRMLEADGMIERKADHRKTIIRIVNYDKFQSSKKRPTAESPENTGLKPIQQTTSRPRENAKLDCEPTNKQTATNVDNTRDCGNGQTAEQTDNPITNRQQSRPHINNISNSNKRNNNKNIEPCHKYGEYGNVLLTDKQFEKLKKEFPDDWKDWIALVDEYCAMNGKRYSDYLATIRNWNRRNKEKKGDKQSGSNKQRELYDEGGSF